MAKLKGTTYEELYQLLDGKSSIVIGNNTTAEEAPDGTIVIRLHNSPIVELHYDQVRFTLAGYPTVTTRERINQFIGPKYRVYQENHVQKLSGRTREHEISDSEWYTAHL